MKRFIAIIIMGMLMLSLASCSSDAEGIIPYNDNYDYYERGIGYTDTDGKQIRLSEENDQYRGHINVALFPYQAEFLDKTITIEAPHYYQWGPSSQGAVLLFCCYPHRRIQAFDAGD